MKRYIHSKTEERYSEDMTIDDSKLFDICQSEVDDMENDYDNDTLDTLYDRLVSAVEFRLGRELKNKEQSLILNWLESDSFTFPEYEDDYYEDD